MTVQDRTKEFVSTVNSIQDRMNGYVEIRKNPKPMKNQPEWTQFTRLAKKIGSDISSTFMKLEKLTMLAKTKSLFDDKTQDIQELTHIIKQDISALNKQIADLQKTVNSRYSSQAKNCQSHSKSVVVSLQYKLASMSNNFKQVLEVRTENLKHQKNRRDQFSQGYQDYSLPNFEGHSSSSSLLLQNKKTCAIDMGGFQQQDQLQLIDRQDSYIQSRANDMQNIESHILELGVIFQQLGQMVHEQDEMVQRIDANVEDASLNIESAHSELVRYFQSVTSSRSLMFKVFGVLIVFFFIFIVVSSF